MSPEALLSPDDTPIEVALPGGSTSAPAFCGSGVSRTAMTGQRRAAVVLESPCQDSRHGQSWPRLLGHAGKYRLNVAPKFREEDSNEPARR